MKYILSIVLLAICAAHADVDPFIGVWSMNVAKSKYENAAPKSMRIVMEPTAEGIRYRSEIIRADASVSTAEYTANYDGKPMAVVTNRGLMAPIALKRIDMNTVEASYIRGLLVVATSRRSLSENGHVMTITTVTYDEHHQATTNVGVYERVPTKAN